MGLADEYTKSVWRQRKVNALYPPNDTIQLGDVVEYHRGVYSRRTTLQDLGILDELDPPLTVRSGKMASWALKSENGVEVHAKLKGKVVPGIPLRDLGDADAGAVVTMEEDNSYLLSLSKIDVESFASVLQLSGPIGHRFWRNKWDTKWIIVTEIWRPAHCTFLGSASRKAQFELRANATVRKATLGEADLSAGFSLAGHTADQDAFTDHDATVPLFRGYRWLLTMKPAGRQPRMLKIINSATFDSLGDDLQSVVGPLAPTPFDPTD